MRKLQNCARLGLVVFAVTATSPGLAVAVGVQATVSTTRIDVGGTISGTFAGDTGADQILDASELTAAVFEYRDSGGTLVASWELTEIQGGFISLFQYDVPANALTIQNWLDFIAPFGNGDDLDLFPPPDAVAWNLNDGATDDCLRVVGNCDTVVSATITPPATPPAGAPTTSQSVLLFVLAMLLALGGRSLVLARAARG